MDHFEIVESHLIGDWLDMHIPCRLLVNVIQNLRAIFFLTQGMKNLRCAAGLRFFRVYQIDRDVR